MRDIETIYIYRCQSKTGHTHDKNNTTWNIDAYCARVPKRFTSDGIESNDLTRAYQINTPIRLPLRRPQRWI